MAQRLAENKFTLPSVPRAAQELIQVVAFTLFILWTIKMASHILGIVLMGIMLGYCFLPFVNWIMRRWERSRTTAIALSLIVIVTFSVILGFFVWRAAVNMKAKVPVYEEQLIAFEAKAAGFAESRGIKVGNLAARREARTEQFLNAAQAAIPDAANSMGDLALMFLLGWVFLFEMVPEPGTKRNRLSEALDYYDNEMQAYIGIQAKSGAIASLANLVLLIALGVDFPILWAVLFFLLNFIPILGFILAMVPPTILALLEMGWERALMVAVGMTVINLLSEYVLTPRLMKAGVDVSFLEITISLLFWGFLLGAWGGVLAVPLTLALRKSVAVFSGNEEAAEAQAT